MPAFQSSQWRTEASPIRDCRHGSPFSRPVGVHLDYRPAELKTVPGNPLSCVSRSPGLPRGCAGSPMLRSTGRNLPTTTGNTPALTGESRNRRFAFGDSHDLPHVKGGTRHRRGIRLRVDDLDQAEPRLLELGATNQPAEHRWRVLIDPAGHPFCLTRA
ncbi:VOC family protein [Nocardia rhizosphaerihabitans]|uniref:VOC family protein n=1 Tax=Nocardia rhizosphaerihabitans TaxID=1691570 RepID=UPI0027E4FAAF|nr:VOC family protein [Nocardia rhizosphaerihabitans]